MKIGDTVLITSSDYPFIPSGIYAIIDEIFPHKNNSVRLIHEDFPVNDLTGRKGWYFESQEFENQS